MVEHINIIKYREIPNKFCLTARLLLKILLILKFIIIIINLFGYSLYLFNVPQYLVTFSYDIILIILGICSFSLVNKFKYVLLSIAGLFIAVAYGSNVFTYNETCIYNEYTSPDNNTTIITKSSGYLFSGKTNYYIKLGAVLKNTNKTVELDEGYQQIRNATTEIIWEEQLATFYYYDNDENLLLTKVIEFDA